MDTYSWYTELVKPSWAPPAWIFGPVWTILYIIIFVTFSTVFYRALTGKLPLMVALPFALNLLFNFAFSPIQFGLKNNILASIDILLVLGTLIWALVAVWKSAPELRWVTYANIPYFLWVLFASILQFTITFLNA